MPPCKIVLLDTCVLINLIASGQAKDILGTVEEKFMICSAVEKESIFLRASDPEGPPEAVQTHSLTESGHLDVCYLANEEEERLYVDYASHLDDGEAMSLAIAQSRGFVLATDDRKARRLFLDAVHDPARLLSTPGILRTWSERAGVSQVKLKALLSRVTLRARFLPPSDDPHYQWWCEVCDPTQEQP